MQLSKAQMTSVVLCKCVASVLVEFLSSLGTDRKGYESTSLQIPALPAADWVILGKCFNFLGYH